MLLALLLRQTGTLVTREQITSELWPAFPPAHPNAGINNTISKLRQLLDDPPDKSALIRNIAGSGYEFCGALGAAESESGRLPVAVVLSAVAALSTVVALFTTAVGTAATAYFVFAVLLIIAFDKLKDTAFTRGTVSTVLFIGMAYVPSAWTLYDLSGVVINFDALPPAAVYPFVTGMKFLPIFSLVLMWWTFDALLPSRMLWRRSTATFWSLACLFVGMTAASLAAYSGEIELIGGRVPGWTRLALGYTAVTVVNVSLGAIALRILRRDDTRRSQRLLVVCGFAYLALLGPAIVIGQEYNAINRHFLSARRRHVYRAQHPESIGTILDAGRRRDIGMDLHHLLNDRWFIAALREARFYRVDLDERFQIFRRAVTFGYEDPASRSGQRSFRLVRFPADVAAALDFQQTGE